MAGVYWRSVVLQPLRTAVREALNVWKPTFSLEAASLDHIRVKLSFLITLLHRPASAIENAGRYQSENFVAYRNRITFDRRWLPVRVTVALSTQNFD